ncbi:MAG: malectin domain-containing carbohydrate-binding protein, partial [Aurantibacter sp.]
PTNASTTIVATSPVVADGTTTSTVTVTIADTKGDRFTSSAGTVALVATGSASVSAVTDNGDGSYTATVTNTTAETVTISGTLDSSTITDTADITFNPLLMEDTLIIAINSGGEEVMIDMVTFVKDTLFILPSEAFGNDQIADVLGTEADTLYVTERIRGASLGTIGYSIPVDSAMYEVKLHFAEIFWGLDGQGGMAGGAGSRVFDVMVEDSLVLDDFDIFTDAGGAATATIKMHETVVVDDTLNVVLTASVDQPKISALEVIKKAEN